MVFYLEVRALRNTLFLFGFLWSGGGFSCKHRTASLGSRKHQKKPLLGKVLHAQGFARQQWRAWIETQPSPSTPATRAGSPVSNGGRGLKRVQRFRGAAPGEGFARQQWRAWIETLRQSTASVPCFGSPVSNGGRGLKHATAAGRMELTHGSPVSNGGRGLKHVARRHLAAAGRVRPSAMAGVD